MENNDVEDGSLKGYDIQYNVHFDNSEDYSRSDTSNSVESDSHHPETPEKERSNLSDSKQILGEYQDGFLQDFELKIQKAVSFKPPSLPKFQLNDYANYNSILADNLIKDDEVNNILNHSKEEILSSVPESEDQDKLSQEEPYSDQDQDLGFGEGDYGTNLLVENGLELDILGNTNNDNEFSPSKIDSCARTSKGLSLSKKSGSGDQRQFVCPEKGCGKKFLDNSKLKRHLLVHSGEKPYGCHI